MEGAKERNYDQLAIELGERWLGDDNIKFFEALEIVAKEHGLGDSEKGELSDICSGKMIGVYSEF